MAKKEMECLTPVRPKFISGKLACTLYGITEEILKNARENALFPFYKPQKTNVIYYRPEDIEAYIESGRVI